MRIAFVSGSTRGIGRAIADRLHDRGYRVVYSGTRQERPADLPADRDYFGCNIGDGEQRRAAFRYLAEEYGRLDVLVNNAGVAPLIREDVLRMSEESFDRVIGINLRGTFFMCQLAANMMLRHIVAEDYHPRIINIGSISAYTSSTARGEYCISKAGVGMVTQLMADGLLPIPRFGRPEDVADMVEACCTGLMDYAAGQVLNADGGFSLRRL